MLYKPRTVIAWLAAKMKWSSELNRYRSNMRSRLAIVHTARTHLSTAERLFLYSLVRGTMPERVLEIGTAQGGSAAIIAAAMEDNGIGTLIGIDPVPRVDTSLPSYYKRFKTLECAAPKGVDEAARMAGGKFDLVFYDGPNVNSAASEILAAIIPHLAERAYLVIDNALHYGLHQTIIDAVEAESRLHDCGFVCVKLSVHDRNVAYGGLRLVRFESNNVSDPYPIIDREYRAAGLPVPVYDPEVLNHGGWWCREVRACPRCAREAASASSITSSGRRAYDD
jgi:predicted O-methyltransferase YrrM